MNNFVSFCVYKKMASDDKIKAIGEDIILVEI